MAQQDVQVEDIDFALAAWREEGVWSVSTLPARLVCSMDTLSMALRQLPGEGGVYGFVGLNEDCLLIFHQSPAGLRAVVSNAAAIDDWDLAEQALQFTGAVAEDSDEWDEFTAVGELSILTDLGVDTDELADLLEDEDLYPDEQVAAIAERAGFAQQVAEILGDD